MAKHRAHALANDARAVVDDVVELLAVPVDVGDEVLGCLGQVENGLEVDHLGVDGLACRELLGQKHEVLRALVIVHVRCHSAPSAHGRPAIVDPDAPDARKP